MSYREVMADVNITYGGLFSDGYDCIEVTDLDSAAGVEGCILIQCGSVYINADHIKSASSFVGMEDETALVDSVIRATCFLDRQCFGELDKLESRIGQNAARHALMGIEWLQAYQGLEVSESILFVPAKPTDDTDYNVGYTDDEANKLAISWRADLELVEDDDMESVINTWLKEHNADRP